MKIEKEQPPTHKMRMMLHSNPLFCISFCNKNDAYRPEEFRACSSAQNLLEKPQLSHLQRAMQLETIIVPNQTHSTKGICVTTPDDMHGLKPYNTEADFVITSLSHVGIAIGTADCLPIVIYDSSSHAIAVIHASWKNSLAGVARIAVETLLERCNTKLDYLKVFFGPCAKVSAYEVSADFEENLKECPFKKEVLIVKNGKSFFNLPLYNQLVLEQMGVNRSSFKLDYNLCTISNESFCSHRREKGSALRQFTVAVLK